MIRTQSLPSGSDSPDFCSNSLLAAHFVALAVYDTVVLISRLKIGNINALINHGPSE
jgi:hypothetical protein